MQDLLGYFLAYKYLIYLLIFAAAAGLELVSKVPAVLHTPLTSGISIIHGAVLVGAILSVGKAKSEDVVSLGFGFAAVVLSSWNLIGAIILTDRTVQKLKNRENQEGKS